MVKAAGFLLYGSIAEEGNFCIQGHAATQGRLIWFSSFGAGACVCMHPYGRGTIQSIIPGNKENVKGSDGNLRFGRSR